MWSPALPRLRADTEVIGRSHHAGQRELSCAAIIAWGEREKTWRQGIRVSADELADAAGSMAAAWQGEQQQPSRSHQSLLSWVNAREEKQGRGPGPAGPCLITSGHIRERPAHRH